MNVLAPNRYQKMKIKREKVLQWYNLVGNSKNYMHNSKAYAGNKLTCIEKEVKNIN